MTDLTMIATPFGLLTPGLQDALKAAHASGATIEVFTPMRTQSAHWQRVLSPVWNDAFAYRVQPTPLRDIDIPWDSLHESWIAAARCKDGSIRIFDRVPMTRNEDWDCDGLMGVKIDRIINIDPGNKPWNQSLVFRPGYCKECL